MGIRARGSHQTRAPVNANVRRRMDLPASLVSEYRAALVTGAALAPAEEVRLYALHSESLDQLVALAGRPALGSELSSLLAKERRAYGWSFLSGEHGARAERAFDTLASSLEALLAGDK